MKRDNSDKLLLDIKVENPQPITQLWIRYAIGRNCENVDLALKLFYQVDIKDGDKTKQAIAWKDSVTGWHVLGLDKKNEYIYTLPYYAQKDRSISILQYGCDEACVFQNIFDFLIFMVLKKDLNKDIVILNSCNSKEVFRTLLSGYKLCHIYLDNDDDGDFAVDVIELAIGKTKVRDHRTVYRNQCITKLSSYVNQLLAEKRLGK